jgi:hypothetical protein
MVLKKIAAFFCLLLVSVFGQGYDTYSGFTVPTTAVLPAAETHPALFFTASQVSAIKNKKNADSYAGTIWSRVTPLISSFKSKDPGATDINTRPQMAKVLALNWILTGDTTSRRLAIACLSTAYDNVPRTANSSDFDGDYDEIYRATWLQNYCEAYDWVYSALTAAQNTDIRNRIATETLLLQNNMVAGAKYAPRPHNHRSKPAWAIVTAALTMSSDSRAAGWLTFGLTQANTVTKYMFSSDGIYREGSHYMLYSYVNYLPYLWHYKNVSGVDHFQYFKPTFEMPILIRNGKGWLPNIEDGYEKPFPGHMAAAAYMSPPTLLHPSEPLGKILQWNWVNTNFFTTGYTGATNDAVWDVDEYLTYDPSIAAIAPVYNGTLSTLSGVTVFRDSTLAQAPTKYLLFHAVAECDNHNHPDQLSYVLAYKNTILATDAGYGKDGSSDANRSWYTSAEAHNIVLTNGSEPQDPAVNIAPANKKFISSPVCDLSEKEALTVATSGKIRRGIIFPERNYWVVYDLMTASATANYQLNIHSRGTLALNGNSATWTENADIYGKGARLHSYILASEPDTLAIASGTTSLYKVADTQYYVKASMTKNNAAFLHLLYPCDSTVAFPSLTNLSGNNVIGFSVNTSGSLVQQTTLLRQTNSLTTNNRLTTDAICLWAKQDTNKIYKYLLDEGKTLLMKGVSYLSASQNVSCTVDLSAADKCTVQTDTVPAGLKLSFYPGFIPDAQCTVTINGSLSAYSLDSNRVSITLPAGASKIQITRTPSTIHNDNSGRSPRKAMDISSIYPNPFNPSTRIVVTFDKPTEAELAIFDILGNRVATVIPRSLQQGTISVLWNAKNDAGQQVPSGCYFARLTNTETTVTKKLITLK